MIYSNVMIAFISTCMRVSAVVSDLSYMQTYHKVLGLSGIRHVIINTVCPLTAHFIHNSHNLLSIVCRTVYSALIVFPEILRIVCQSFVWSNVLHCCYKHWPILMIIKLSDNQPNYESWLLCCSMGCQFVRTNILFDLPLRHFDLTNDWCPTVIICLVSFYIWHKVSTCISVCYSLSSWWQKLPFLCS